MRILIAFDGTGIEQQNQNTIERVDNCLDVVRIYFKGCHALNTGGNTLFPDIPGMTKKLANLFDRNELDLDELKKTFGEDVAIEPFDSQATNEHPVAYGKISTIDEMALVGYSRGCIASFSLARELYSNGNTIPVRIVANQPVPGNSYEGWNTLVSEVTDLSMCTNIRSASVVIGSYANQFGLSGKNAIASFVHKLFFKQVVPFFSPETKIDIRECPIASHFSRNGVHLGYLHMLRALEEHKYCAPQNVFNKRIISLLQQNETIFLSATEDKQAIFGNTNDINPDPLLVKVIDDCVNQILDWYYSATGIHAGDELSLEQKKAIYSLSTRDMDADELIPVLGMVLSNEASGKKLVKIINSSTGMIANTLQYLSDLSFKDTCHDKEYSISEHKNAYLKDIFMISCQFLSLHSPAQQDINALTDNLANANKRILNEVTNKHANPVLDTCITIIQNIVLGILTLGGAFIYNAIKNHGFFFIKNTETSNQLLSAAEKTHELLLSP